MAIVSISLCSHLTTWGRKLLPKHTHATFSNSMKRPSPLIAILSSKMGDDMAHGLAYLAQRFQTWIIALVAKPAPFAPGCYDEVRFDSLDGIFCNRATVAQGFVVGMCQHTHQFQPVRHGFSSPLSEIKKQFYAFIVKMRQSVDCC